jgi:predicted DNA-binding transcriptional regulator YafY
MAVKEAELTQAELFALLAAARVLKHVSHTQQSPDPNLDSAIQKLEAMFDASSSQAS